MMIKSNALKYTVLAIVFTLFSIGINAQNTTLDFNNGDINLGNIVGDNLRTIECWFKLDTAIDPSLATIQTLIYRHASSSNGDFGLYFGQSNLTGREGRLVFTRRIGSNSYNCVSNNDTWAANEWHHVAGIIHPSQGMKLYIDGVLQNSTHATTEKTAASASNLHVGNFGNNTRFFDGEIDNIGLWSVALFPYQIVDHAAMQCYPFFPDNIITLAGFYNFENDVPASTMVTDASINPEHGTRDLSTTTLITGACYVYQPPYIDPYENNSAGINNVSKLNLGGTVGNGVRSIECWFKLNEAIDASLPLAQALIYRNSAMGDHDYGFFFGASNWSGRQGRLVFNRSGGSTLNHVVSNSNSWAANEWHHVVGVIDPVTGMALYIDGVKQNSTQSTTFAVYSKTTNTQIGAWGSTSNRYFDGNIDEVRLWGRALTQAEISLNMCGFDPATTPTGLKAHYDFEGDASTWLHDKSGNNYHATNSTTVATQDIGQSCYKNAYNRTVVPAALHLDGANDNGTIHSAAGHDLRTVECWFKLTNNIDNTLAETQALLFKSIPNSVGDFGLYFGQSDWTGKEGKLVFERKLISASHYVVSDSDSWTADVWHHVAGVIDPTNGMELYIDGVKQTDTEPSTQTTEETGFNFTVGSWSINNGFFEGDIDEIRLWTRALTQAEINANNCNSFDPAVQTGLRSYYNFDHNTGSSNVTDLATGFLFGLHGGATRIGDDPCGITIHSGIDTIAVCNGAPYQWIDGSYYSTNINSGVFHTIVGGSVDGNDSIVELNLTIGQPAPTIDTQTACGSYTWIDGIIYTANNSTATFVTTNADGCDQATTLNLTINATTSATDVQSACGSYTWLDGVTYTASNNTATFVTTNAAGCDHTNTLDLTINAPTSATDVQTACDSYTWIDGVTYTASNNAATFVTTNAAGCDHTNTLNLTINTTTSSTDVQTACGSYTWMDGITYTASNNTATFITTNAAGCDHTNTLDLTINAATSSTDVQTACESYTWMDGITYTASNNTATFVTTNAAGCDHTNTLDLTINTPTSSTDAQTTCESYTWMDGVTYTTSNNTATFVTTNAAGCDHTNTLNLTINAPTSSTDVQTACDSYTWIDGVTYTANNNSATFITTNANGCDHINTLNLVVTNSTSSTDVQTACGSYTWMNGITYTVSNNTATFMTINNAGCLHVNTLDLTINTSTTRTDVQSACESYTWIDGITYTANNNTATFMMTNTNGCDELVTLNLIISMETTSTDVQVACGSYTWIDGVTYTASNNTATFATTTNTCNHTATLDLTINEPTSSTDEISACGSYTWIDGITYATSNNTATFITTNADGCDHVNNLLLDIEAIFTIDVTLNNGTLTASNPSTALFQWIDCSTNTPIANATGQSFTPTASGDYAVEVTEGLCPRTSDCVNFMVTGIEELSDQKSIVIYPNPTTGQVTFKATEEIATIEIYNVTGVKVAQYENQSEINIQHLSSGIYIAKISIGSLSVIRRIVKE